VRSNKLIIFQAAVGVFSLIVWFIIMQDLAASAYSRFRNKNLILK